MAAPSAGYPTTPLTDAEKVDIRRFAGYPAYGAGASGFSSWRYFEAYGMLEYRLNNLSAAEFQVLRQYVAQLYTLETAIPSTSDNLDTDQAAVWFHNKNELRDREQLFDAWRKRLCGFLGIPPGPALNVGGGPRVIV